ncbi:Crp/Fnr family transcriptional regulator [Methylobacterium nodulans]|uniref:Transcriptional regulator, Crp/Fnr family n=1 Tax=Methylobacterium nodulans (strain LMG 21967 / CNCM I-2342 / ORS 2060) TaxID=460265 RepID=B8IJP9_METNO|nr:Crp/Fnr family transcriptional regulator [Methylobacterium nodulans]ACL58097.1 transcriptional regulator, Crp/Fnr family [Methylobacterium nodulans ORS 2060]
MQNCTTAKIRRLTDLSGTDREAFNKLVLKWRYVAARDDLFQEGDCLGHVSLILSGWAYRYKQLEDGRRQIAGFLLPGDLTEAFVPEGYEMDCSIAALTPITCADISLKAFAAVCEQHPAVQQALLWESIIAASIQREWMLNVGQRVGTERVGHLLCELFLRLRRTGLTEDSSFVLPVTQFDMANALGLSHVHINRKLAELREQGLVELVGRRLRIPDIAALQAASFFNPNYLYLDKSAIRAKAPTWLTRSEVDRASSDALPLGAPPAFCEPFCDSGQTDGSPQLKILMRPAEVRGRAGLSLSGTYLK